MNMIAWIMMIIMEASLDIVSYKTAFPYTFSDIEPHQNLNTDQCVHPGLL